MRRIGLVAGAQIKMVGIGENDLRAQRFQHVLRNGLHRSRRAHRHKDRRLHRPVRQAKLPAPPARISFRNNFELRTHPTILPSAPAVALPLFSHFLAKPHKKTNPRLTRHSQRCGRRLGVFNLPIEQIFARREELKPLAEVVRSVGVQTKVSVQQVRLASSSNWRPLNRPCRFNVPSAGLNARTFIVARLRATSGIQLPTSVVSGLFFVTVACAY
jgi:hypothetical protein